VDIKVRKVHNLLSVCRKACAATWGLRPKESHWLYVSIIRPSITFASLVWWPDCQTASANKKLRSVQRLVCLGISGAMRITPTNIVEARICLPPMELVVESEMSSAAHRLESVRQVLPISQSRK